MTTKKPRPGKRPRGRSPIDVDVHIHVTVTRTQLARLMPFAWGLMGGIRGKKPTIAEAVRLAIEMAGSNNYGVYFTVAQISAKVR